MVSAQVADNALETIAVVRVPALLSIARTAQVLGRSPRTVRRRIDSGDLPAVVEHGQVMVRGDELLAYIDQLQRVSSDSRSPRRGRRQAERRFDFLRDSTPPPESAC